MIFTKQTAIFLTTMTTPSVEGIRSSAFMGHISPIPTVSILTCKKMTIILD